MAVVIRIAGKCNLITVLETDQALHRVAGGRVHANLAIPVDGHEAERRVDKFIDHIQIQAVMLANRRPVIHSGAAQRVDTKTQARVADGVHVDHVLQVGHVGVDVIMAVRGIGTQRFFMADA